MVAIGIISVAAFAIWLAVWSDVWSREEADRDLEIDYRAERIYELADVADRLREKLGREPTVREIYAAIEPDEPETETVVDLRQRIRRITKDSDEAQIA